MSINKPEKPKFSKGYIIGIIIGVLIFFSSFLLLSTNSYDRDYSINHGNGDPIFYGFFFMIVGIAIIIFVVVKFNKAKSMYELSLEDFEKYKKIIEAENEKAQRAAEAENKRWQEEQKKIPYCPICQSHNVSRISTMNRTASIAVAGLASSKIGKQFECKNCGYKW